MKPILKRGFTIAIVFHNSGEDIYYYSPLVIFNQIIFAYQISLLANTNLFAKANYCSIPRNDSMEIIKMEYFKIIQAVKKVRYTKKNMKMDGIVNNIIL